MPLTFLDSPVPLAFAHRGGAADGDENTAEAFGRAVALGYRYVETDVHATADGVPVVFHDASLDRLTGAAGRVADLRWADLATLRIGGAGAVPRLDDVLAAWPGVRFNIDVKADPAVAPTVDAVRAAAATDRVLLASFSDARLARLRALAGPRVATSLGRGEVARLRVSSLLGTPLRLPPSAVAAQVPTRHGPLPIVDRRFLARAHRLGLQVHVWTIDDPREMNRLLDLGVDGLMTDRPEVLRDVYAARGAWPG
ncbi:glycerophosphodiester phosphodiesterase [Amorphoplanes nipponensis]|uniref:Glycerophosphoryl diester phosphodiesterase n=1 Tax=Actinoplanes nipponensis TaxID=135950 RepID=A0A919MJ34_9ACTN|nr:glycerophosphodiester phosphodiesterase [Actinoplanes nipponensis]GIE51394.1 glycerophosphoryl diester phosphodiesterase [Actinoplanes nipponensis]